MPESNDGEIRFRATIDASGVDKPARDVQKSVGALARAVANALGGGVKTVKSLQDELKRANSEAASQGKQVDRLRKKFEDLSKVKTTPQLSGMAKELAKQEQALTVWRKSQSEARAKLGDAPPRPMLVEWERENEELARFEAGVKRLRESVATRKQMLSDPEYADTTQSERARLIEERKAIAEQRARMNPVQDQALISRRKLDLETEQSKLAQISEELAGITESYKLEGELADELGGKLGTVNARLEEAQSRHKALSYEIESINDRLHSVPLGTTDPAEKRLREADEAQQAPLLAEDNALKKEIQRLIKSRDDLYRELEELDKPGGASDAFEDKQQEYERQLQTIREQEGKLEQANKLLIDTPEMKEADAEIIRISQRLEDLKAAARETETAFGEVWRSQEVRGLNLEIERAQAEMARLNEAAQSTAETLRVQQSEAERLARLYQAFSAQYLIDPESGEAALKNAQAEADELKSRLESASASWSGAAFGEASARIAEARDQLAELQARIERLKTPAARNPFSRSTELLSDERVSTTSFGAELEAARAREAELQDRLSALQANLAALHMSEQPTDEMLQLQSRIAEATQRLEVMRRAAESVGKASARDERIARYRSDPAEADADMAQIRDQIEQLRARLIEGETYGAPSDSLNETAQRIAQLTREYAALREAKESAMRENGSSAGGVLNRIANASANAGRSLQRLAHGLNRVVSGGIQKGLSAVQAGIGWIGRKGAAAFQRIGGVISPATKSVSSMGEGISRSISHIKRLVVGALIFNTLRRAIREATSSLSAMLNTNAQFAQSLANIKWNLAVAFTPIYQAILPALNALMAVLGRVTAAIASFFALLGGKTIAQTQADTKALQAQTEAIKGSGGAAKQAEKEIKKYLASFDDIQTIGEKKQEDSGGGGGGGGGIGALEPEEIEPGWLEEIWAQYETMPERFYQIGLHIGQAITAWMDAIDWDKIHATAALLGESFAMLFNGLMDGIDWDLLGVTLAQGLNTIIIFADEFIKAFDWHKMGQSFSDGLNGLIGAIKWDRLASTVYNGINGIADAMYTFFTETDWAGLGRHFGDTLNDIFTNVDFDLAGRALASKVNALFATISGFVAAFDWKAAGARVGESIRAWFDEIDWAQIGKAAGDSATGVLDWITAALTALDWEQIGRDVATFLLSVDWAGVWESIEGLIGAAITGMMEFLEGLFGDTKLGKAVLDFFQWLLDHGSAVAAIIGSVAAAVGVLKAMLDIAKFITDVHKSINTLSKAFSGLGNVMGGLGIAAIGGIIIGLTDMLDLSTPLSIALDILGGAFIALGAAMTLGFGPIGWAVGIVAGLGAAIAAITSELNEDCLPALDWFGEGVSKITLDKMNPFIDTFEGALYGIRELAFGAAESANGMADDVIGAFRRMREMALNEVEQQRKEALDNLNYLFAEEAAVYEGRLAAIQSHYDESLAALQNDTSLSKEQYDAKSEALRAAMLDEIAALKEGATEEELAYLNRLISTQSFYDNKSSEVTAREEAIREILKTAAIEERAVTQDEYDQLIALGYEFYDASVEAMIESVDEQEAIKKQAADQQVLLSQRQASDILAQAARERDGSIQAAKDKYQDVLARARLLAADGSAESKKMADNMIAEAKRARDDEIKAAEEKYDGILEEARTGTANLDKVIDTSNGEILTKWQIFWKSAGDGFSSLWDNVSSWCSSAYDSVVDAWKDYGTWIQTKVVDPVVKFFTEMWDNAKRLASDAWDGIVNVWTTVSEWFGTNVIEPIKGFFSEAWDSIKEMASGAWDGITGIFKSAGTWFGENVKQPIVDTFNGVVTWVSGTLKGAWEAAWNGLKTAFVSVWNGITSFFTGVRDTIGGIVNTVTGWLNTILGKKQTAEAANSSMAAMAGGGSANGGGSFYRLDGAPISPYAVANLGVLEDSRLLPVMAMRAFEIPGLATGTVVPPNKPFLAAMGDNTREAEIVSPLSTMKQAFGEVLSASAFGSFSGSAPTSVNMYIDGTKFASVIVDLFNIEQGRRGTNLVPRLS